MILLGYGYSPILNSVIILPQISTGTTAILQDFLHNPANSRN
jgi:hypothetical protein